MPEEKYTVRVYIRDRMFASAPLPKKDLEELVLGFHSPGDGVLRFPHHGADRMVAIRTESIDVFTYDFTEDMR